MTLLKARWIIPVTSEPIENGWIHIENGIISNRGTGPVGATHASPFDLGNAALFPGLINCHAHLEFDRGNHPHDSFAKWAESVQASQPEASATESIWQRNSQRLIQTGTTTVVNHGNQIAGALRQAQDAPTPHVIQICEFVGASAENGARSYRDACAQRKALLESDLIEDAVVSPHSLYAVSPVVWEEFIKHRRGAVSAPAIDNGYGRGDPAPTELISIHIKESAEEEQLFTSGKGPLARLVKERGGLLWQHDPVGWLKEKQLLRRGTLLIHGNYLDERDLAHLHGSGASVIHCPGSHAYFGHQCFPFEAIRKHEIRVALGTDSLASNEDISMLRELQLLRRGAVSAPAIGDDNGRGNPAPTDSELIQMTTINGAEALGIADTRGSLETDKWADIIAVPMHSFDDPYEALLNADQVGMTMVRGRIVHRDGL